MKKKLLAFIVSFVLLAGTQVLPVLATAGADTVLWDGQAANVQATSGLGNNDPRRIAASIINIILGFLGILSLALILFAGFKWMTAAGNEDQVGAAKKTLISGVIGLIIILSSYALAAFILDAIFDVTTV
jgi:hypothetical protein